MRSEKNKTKPQNQKRKTVQSIDILPRGPFSIKVSIKGRRKQRQLLEGRECESGLVEQQEKEDMLRGE